MANLLKNPSFEMPALPPTSNPQTDVPGLSAGSNWTTWNNSKAITTTDILPSTRPGGGKQMIHVCTTGSNNGLVQAFLPHTEPGIQHATSSVWVFVLRGKVGMGTGDGGNTGIDAQSTTTGQWEELKAPNGGKPVNEFIVYSVSPAGACYYIDDATVSQAHG